MSSNDTVAVIERLSSVPFDETVERLTRAIENAGMTIFAKIDHAGNAKDVGLKMPPATVLIYGNAKGGTPIMVACPLAALDLPLRILIRETEAGKAAVVLHPVKAMLGLAGVPEEMATRLGPAQALLLATVTR